MSTFAVFGMTASAALGDARKQTKITKPSGKAGCPPLELTPSEWNEAVQRNADAIMAGEKVKQLSALFDTPLHAQQFIDLAKKAGACRDLKIRCKAALLDVKGKKILSPKTRMPVIGWSDYLPGREVA
ncbi:hypothetical protein KMS_R34240 [Pseudomonas sp. LRP2-20]|uniref:hypothetical protein n=1 Tax=Pseudomonas sp. LRP2-20 TaxID=2944234 RepID=UPI002186C0E3|nr:hypothetical protein [Pseudomonas sp. LRP2-20]BDM23667.1 hypothetical protein KMS_R34240 [Pseudomonas sp. LRP2-20]